MVLALVLFSFIFAAIYSLLNSVIDSDVRSDRAFDNVAKSEISWQIIRQDLLSIVRRPSKDIFGDPVPAFNLKRGSGLTFVRWIEVLSGEGKAKRLQKIEYLKREGEFVRRSWPVPDLDPETPFEERVLFNDLADLEISVFDPQGRVYADWPASDDLILSMPELVQISARYDGGFTVVHEYPGLGE